MGARRLHGLVVVAALLTACGPPSVREASHFSTGTVPEHTAPSPTSAPTTTAAPSTTVHATTTATARTTTTPPTASTTQRVGTQSITMSRGMDEEANRPAIFIVYRFDQYLDPSAGAVISLYENGKLVGRIPFMSDWDGEARAFFQVIDTSTNASIYASGYLKRTSGNVVPGSLVQTAPQQWPVQVRAGQVVAG